MPPAASARSFLIPRKDFEPAYLGLHRSGELVLRAQQAVAGLQECCACPRACRVNRLANESGVCKVGRLAMVSSCFPHLGEENCLRGWSGSGTIFFSMCNLRCVFCQNFDISQVANGKPTDALQLAQMMLHLQTIGCHNINFVTPEHVVPQVLEAVALAAEGGLRLPLVYNTSAYDSLHSLQLMDGVVDIYMPDFKIWDPRLSLRYLRAKDYPQVAREAIREMHRQVGPLAFDESGLAVRGVLLRHLVMPGSLAGTRQIMRFLAQDVSPDTYVNLMAQYRPAGKVDAQHYPELNWHITRQEYLSALATARQAGLWRFDER